MGPYAPARCFCQCRQKYSCRPGGSPCPSEGGDLSAILHVQTNEAGVQQEPDLEPSKGELISGSMMELLARGKGTSWGQNKGL